MSDVFRNGRFEADDWVLLDDDADVPAEGAAFVSLGRWTAERDALAGRNAPLGVVIRAGDNVEDIEADVGRFSAIAVDFPKFTDGRGFSSARLLREDFGYTGEIRAIGDVLLDQIPLMRRCGVDAFDVGNEPTRSALEDGTMPEVTLYYQPVGTVAEVPAGTRPWARKPA
ncbi:DUF934 domain-containing protein [Breoghania sp. L-A4]|uniref:DUF934 domain-containing protein n=1 Tax=Breoghania sp. L-A4 TaxID=2304600 RepID=UPI000E35894D|nr:DUF934 domain-containing protein [Breoghania sp. L-A4]AXS39308.1 DUF934 domain-containing protein [Breoghania sp. L-A4]